MTITEKILAGTTALGALLAGVLLFWAIHAGDQRKAAQTALQAANDQLRLASHAQEVGAKVQADHTVAVNKNAVDKEKASASIAQAAQDSPAWANERVPAAVLDSLRN